MRQTRVIDTATRHVRNGEHGYGLVTRTLHWLMVTAIAAQFLIGYAMDADDSGRGRGRGRGGESGRGRGRGGDGFDIFRRRRDAHGARRTRSDDPRAGDCPPHVATDDAAAAVGRGPVVVRAGARRRIRTSPANRGLAPTNGRARRDVGIERDRLGPNRRASNLARRGGWESCTNERGTPDPDGRNLACLVRKSTARRRWREWTAVSCVVCRSWRRRGDAGFIGRRDGFIGAHET